MTVDKNMSCINDNMTVGYKNHRFMIRELVISDKRDDIFHCYYMLLYHMLRREMLRQII